MAAVGSLVAFLVSLLVGGLAIFVAAGVVVGTRSYEYAVFTALVGAVVWALAGAFLTEVPVVGEVLPLIAWVWVIKWRYGGSWLTAGLVGGLAWGAAVLALALLPLAGVDAVGVPFA